jgi:hypothetical protein
MFKFNREANGNIVPDNELVTPYGAFGMTVDEDRGEMFVTIQHDGAVQVFKKNAKGNEDAIRLIQGNKTRLADPHGIAFDPKTRLLYVTNFGTERDETFGVDQPMPNPLNTLQPRGNQARRPNWPAGNLNNADRREVVFGSGKFGPPTITVLSADANGNATPVRVIEGPKAQLNWPVGISIDSDRGEVYVANSAGDSINVYSATSHRRRGADPADQRPEDDAAESEWRLGGYRQRRGVGRQLRQPHRHGVQERRERQRGTDPRDPQRAAQRADDPDQQSLHDRVRQQARRGARAELRGAAAHCRLSDGRRQRCRPEPHHRGPEHTPESHGACDCLRRRA